MAQNDTTTKPAAIQERANYVGSKPLNYNKFDDLEYESDEDDCHPNIEIGTWRRLKEKMRREKGIKKKEPYLVDKWNVTTTNKRYHIDPSKPPKTTDEQQQDQPSQNEPTTTVIDTETTTENKDESSADTTTTTTTTAPTPQTIPSQTTEEKQPQTTEPTSTATATAADVAQPNNEANITEKPEPEPSSTVDDEPYKARSNPQTFLDDNLETLRKFAKTKNDGKANRFIGKHPYLVHEASEGFLITHAVDRAVEGAGKPELARLSRRCLMIHNLVQSCSQQNVSPQIGVERFYAKIGRDPKLTESYKVELNKQVVELMQRIEERRVERLAELQDIPDEFEEDDKAPLGPGGLDPTDVLNSLPKDLQDAFISQNVEDLKQVLGRMDKDEAEYHMRRCVDAGLWVQPDEDNEDGDQVVQEQQEQPEQQQPVAK